ncbi:MAG: hypothetical protein ACM3MF_05045 [Anaerolineae bacterium]
MVASVAMAPTDLISFLFDAQPHPLRAAMAEWLESSRRFTAFVEANDNKIRKKLRTVQDPEAIRDLMLELETAWLLLRERSLGVAYEPQLSTGIRSPDFAVSFTTSLEFMLEVTRLRPPATREGEGQLEPTVLGDRLISLLCSKLGQLVTQKPNVILAGQEGTSITADQVQAALLRLQQRAEREDAAVIQRQGFHDRADFFRYYGRLSALLVRNVPLQDGKPAILWPNPQTRHPLPPKIRTALVRSHTF